MFSITGLEFAYSQAPVTMKALCQAAWLLTIAFGNLMVIIIAESSLFANQVNQLGTVNNNMLNTKNKSDISCLKNQLGTIQVKHPRFSSATGEAKLATVA